MLRQQIPSAKMEHPTGLPLPAGREVSSDIRQALWRKNGQVFLETVMVIIGLATFAVVSMRIFSNLNLNMNERIKHYRESRVDAINNGGGNPIDFLFDYAHSPSIGTGFNPGFDLIFLMEPNIFEATRLLERENNIISVILPYKINQAYYLAKQLKRPSPEEWYFYSSMNIWGQGVGPWWKNGFASQAPGDVPNLKAHYWNVNKWEDCDYKITAPSEQTLWVKWENAAYIELVQDLIQQSQELTQEAYADFGQAISSFKKALGYAPDKIIDKNTDIRVVPAGSSVLLNPGPFNPAPTLEMYGLDNTKPNLDRLKVIEQQNWNNRERIKSTIISLQAAYSGGLNMLIYGRPNSALPEDETNPNIYIVKHGIFGALGHIINIFVRPDPSYFKSVDWYWNYRYYLSNNEWFYYYYNYNPWLPSFLKHDSEVEKYLERLSERVGRINLSENRASSETPINLDDATKNAIKGILTQVLKDAIKDIHDKIYGKGYAAQDVSGISESTVDVVIEEAGNIAEKFNLSWVSLLKDYANDLKWSLDQAKASWDSNEPPEIGQEIYTREGKQAVIEVDVSNHTATLRREILAGEYIAVANGGQGKVTVGSAHSPADAKNPITATIKLEGIDFKRGDAVPRNDPDFSEEKWIRIGDWLYPRLHDGDLVYTSHGWKCKVTSLDNNAHIALIALEDKIQVLDYLQLKDNSLRHAQSVSKLLYRLTIDDVPPDAGIAFSKYLSQQIETLYNLLAKNQVTGPFPGSDLDLAAGIIHFLAWDPGDPAPGDSGPNADLVNTHPLLNGIAERLKNRLDAVKNDWNDEIKFGAELYSIDNNKFTTGQIQRIISEIAGVYDQEALKDILTNPDRENLRLEEVQKILEIRAIQIRRFQLLRSAYLDSWTLYRAMDCHYDSAGKIVVDNAIIGG